MPPRSPSSRGYSGDARRRERRWGWARDLENEAGLELPWTDATSNLRTCQVLCTIKYNRENLLLARVAPGEGIPPDRKYVREHLDAVAEHIHFCRGRVSPAHGNLHRAQSMMARQVQQLGIKSKALNALLFENDAAVFSAECFEAALRIDERQPQNDSNNLVENDDRK